MPLFILVVDDSPDVRELVIEALGDVGGYDVCGASCLATASVILAEGPHGFDLIFSDIRLPDGDGRTFCASLRQRGVSTPFVLMSGLGSDADIAEGFSAGADDYLVKPFRHDDLLDCVDPFRHPNWAVKHMEARAFGPRRGRTGARRPGLPRSDGWPDAEIGAARREGEVRGGL